MPQSPSSRLSLGSPKKSPTKQLPPIKPFAVTFPITPSSSSLKSPTKSPSKGSAGVFPKTPGKNSVFFPQTPSSHHSGGSSSIFSPRTPRSSVSTPSTSITSTPSRQKGDDADTAPETPTTARRQALYDRIRQKSITNSPSKYRLGDQDTPRMSKDQLLKLSQEETRRRCLLGRLGGVAESIWMWVPPCATIPVRPDAVTFFVGSSQALPVQLRLPRPHESVARFHCLRFPLRLSSHPPFPSRTLKLSSL